MTAASNLADTTFHDLAVAAPAALRAIPDGELHELGRLLEATAEGTEEVSPRVAATFRWLASLVAAERLARLADLSRYDDRDITIALGTIQRLLFRPAEPPEPPPWSSTGGQTVFRYLTLALAAEHLRRGHLTQALAGFDLGGAS